VVAGRVWHRCLSGLQGSIAEGPRSLSRFQPTVQRLLQAAARLLGRRGYHMDFVKISDKRPQVGKFGCPFLESLGRA